MGFLSPAFSWTYVIAEVGILLTIGGILMSVNPNAPEFLIAKGCLTLAVLIFAARIGASLVSSGEALPVRLVLTIVIFAAIGLVWTEGWRWISERQVVSAPTKASEAVTTPVTPPVAVEPRRAIPTPAKSLKFYSDNDKNRPGDALYKLSDILITKGEIAAKTIEDFGRLWDRQFLAPKPDAKLLITKFGESQRLITYPQTP